jgi:pimeloyl-ACP methyl ester carboxylesterase
MMNRGDRTKVLRELPCPILFLIGEQDKTVPLQQSLEQCHLPTLAEIHILTGSGHVGMLEEIERSNQLLEEFLTHQLFKYE